MPFPSSPTVGQTYTTPGGVTFEWLASGYWKAIGGGGSATPAPSGVSFPTWTTATRPASPSAGDSGWNTDTSTVEIWNGSSWGAVSGASGNVEFPTWTTATRPASPSAGVSGWNTDTGSIEVWNGSVWDAVGAASGNVEFPTWTTASRPSSPSAGDSGWNTDTGNIEVWNGSAWSDVGGGAGVEFPSWTSATRPSVPTVGQSGLNTDLGFIEIYDGANWDRVGDDPDFAATVATQITALGETLAQLQDEITAAQTELQTLLATNITIDATGSLSAGSAQSAFAALDARVTAKPSVGLVIALG